MAISSPTFHRDRALPENPVLFFRQHPRAPAAAAISLSPPTIARGTRRLTFNRPRSAPPIPPASTPRRKISPFYRPSPPAAIAVRSLFTGIVEEMGRVEHLVPSPDGGFTMTLSAKTVLGGVALGDSIAVNGTCLTVTHFDADSFTVGLSPETLRRTSLGELSRGSLVNLERALRPDSRMGGHFVQGHVDGTGEIVALESEGDSLWVRVRAPPELLRYVVPKGFIAVDGTSLTVVGVYDDEGCFDFMLVAYTQQKVVIPLKKVGDRVNLEVDILGKYVERLLKGGSVGIDAAISS